MNDDVLIHCPCQRCDAERSRLRSAAETDAMYDLAVRAQLLAAQVAELERWKAEAILVIVDWEWVWDALRCPGEYGKSKAAAALAAVNRMNERGDALAEEADRVFIASANRRRLNVAIDDWYTR